MTDIQYEGGDVLCITDFVKSAFTSFEVYIIHEEYTMFTQYVKDKNLTVAVHYKSLTGLQNVFI